MNFLVVYNCCVFSPVDEDDVVDAALLEAVVVPGADVGLQRNGTRRLLLFHSLIGLLGHFVGPKAGFGIIFIHQTTLLGVLLLTYW